MDRVENRTVEAGNRLTTRCRRASGAGGRILSAGFDKFLAKAWAQFHTPIERIDETCPTLLALGMSGLDRAIRTP